MNNTIEIRGLEKSYKQFKLGPVDISVPEGSIYGLIGPNAAGKTTTIDLIMNLSRKDAGEIKAFGLDHMAHEVEVKRRIGYVSPDISYAAWRKVKRIIHFVRQFYPTWDDLYCQQLLETLQIGWDDKITSMSYGSKVKLALVIALSHKPDLLLLDEPTIGIDAVSKKQIYTELLSAVQDGKRTVLISSHSLADIERFTDHLGFIKQGKIILEGYTSDLVERFCMVDFVSPNGSPIPPMKGLYVQEEKGNRLRALLDTGTLSREELSQSGVQDLSESPVTLEELFVSLALAKE